MKNFIKWSSIAFLSALTLVGCSSDSDDVLGTDPEEAVDETATIRITEGGAADDKFTAEINGEAGGTVEGRVIFTTTEGTQRRLYITQTLPGESAMPFEIPTLTNKSTKADDSIDLDADATDGFDYTFDLNVPTDVNGAIVYNFWSTTGKGDFRDATKRLLLGIGSIEVTVGTGTTNDSSIREINGVNLFAPDSAGQTANFFSFLTGEEYVVVSVAGEDASGPEFRFLWDLGYYYPGDSVGASFSSTSFFSTAFPFNVEGFEASADEIAAGEVLNNAYFNLSTMTVAEFDAITMSSELDFVTNSGVENIEGLVVGSVVEFVDNYGNKGLIKITGLVPGFGNNDNITFDVKIQG